MGEASSLAASEFARSKELLELINIIEEVAQR
jgi:hypothetical protein